MKKRKPMVLYTVYDNKTDFPIITAASAKKCADVMGISVGSFYSAVSRAGVRDTRWTFIRYERKRTK